MAQSEIPVGPQLGGASECSLRDENVSQRKPKALRNQAESCHETALSLGLPVFPCLPDKRPTTKSGYEDAVSDPDGIHACDRHNRLIGLPTGIVSASMSVTLIPETAAWIGTGQIKHGCLLPAFTARETAACTCSSKAYPACGAHPASTPPASV